MSDSKDERKNLADKSGKTCKMCGQIFDPSIAFCPIDGTRLPAELVTAQSHELITLPNMVKRSGGRNGGSTAPAASRSKADSESAPAPPRFQAGKESAPATPRLQAGKESAPATPRIKAGKESAPTTPRSEADSESAPATPRLQAGNESIPAPPRANADSEWTMPPRSVDETLVTLDRGDGATSRTQKLSAQANRGSLPIGSILGEQYEILSLVGKGGMSYVYKAKHLHLKKMVAIKSMLPHLMSQTLSLQRFRQEAQAASNLKHPNIIAVYDFGTTDDGEPYLVMDYIEGRSLSEEILNEGRIGVDRSVKIFLQVADALAHAHKNGVVHRDLKPSNVILLEKYGYQDHVNIVDFGIAKMMPQEGSEALNLTQTGDVFGSPLYMSPEQCRGEKLDARSDIYSMGCLMYETLTGHHAIAGDNTMEVLYNHLNQVPEPLSKDGNNIPAALEKIIFKSLAKDPNQRQQSMTELHDQLFAFEQHNTRANFLTKGLDKWALFWLRRRPRTMKETAVTGTAVVALVTIAVLSTNLISLYWAAADSAEANTKLVWQEDVEQLAAADEPFSGELALAMYLRKARAMADDHESPNDIINVEQVGAEGLMKQKAWREAIKLFTKAVEDCTKYNGPLTIKTVAMQMELAQCYTAVRKYDEASQAYKNIYANLGQDLVNDYEDKAMLKYRLGSIAYFQSDWSECVRDLYQTYGVWSKDVHAHESHFHFFNKPEDMAHNYDYGLLISRLATANHRIYDESVKNGGAPDTVALSSAIEFYLKARRFWMSFGSGDDRVKMNTAVAEANYLCLQHLQDKDADLAREYILDFSNIGKFAIFPADSVYRAVILQNESVYFLDKGDFPSAINAKLECWRILAARRKTKS